MHDTSPVSPRILAVIPCLNEEACLEPLIKKLLATTTEPNLCFVIVDGGSNDNTPQIAQDLAQQHANVLFLNNTKRLQSAAINLAVKTFGGNAEFLIRIDAHCDYPQNFCASLIAEAERSCADSIVVAMHTIGKKGFQRVAAAAQNSKLGNGGSAHRLSADGEGQWIEHGHHALMRVEAFRTVGGYDETFAANEDAELDMRLRKKGFKIWLTGKTSIVYYPRATPTALFNQYVSYGYGRARTLLKHHAFPKIRQLLPVFVLPTALLALIGLFVPLLAFPLLAWTLLCIGYGCWSAVRARDPKLLMIGPTAMLMHLGWSFGFWRAILDDRKHR